MHSRSSLGCVIVKPDKQSVVHRTLWHTSKTGGKRHLLLTREFTEEWYNDSTYLKAKMDIARVHVLATYFDSKRWADDFTKMTKEVNEIDASRTDAPARGKESTVIGLTVVLSPTASQALKYYKHAQLRITHHMVLQELDSRIHDGKKAIKRQEAEIQRLQRLIDSV